MGSGSGLFPKRQDRMKDRMGSEMKRLPYVLGKVLGGLMAVAGFGAAVYVYTHRIALPSADAMACLLVGIGGLVIFRFSSWLLMKRSGNDDGPTPGVNEKMKTSAIPWIILLVLAAAFVIFMLFLGR